MVVAKSRTTITSSFNELTGQEQCLKDLYKFPLNLLSLIFHFYLTQAETLKFSWRHLWKTWDTNGGFWLCMMKRKVNQAKRALMYDYSVVATWLSSVMDLQHV